MSNFQVRRLYRRDLRLIVNQSGVKNVHTKRSVDTINNPVETTLPTIRYELFKQPKLPQLICCP